MPELEWDKTGDKVYESGIDRGVLYLPAGDAVPWNGLTSVVEKIDRSITDVYYDGQKIGNQISLGSFSATLSAFTYPDAMDELEGMAQIRDGVFLGEQPPTTFALSYRSRIGDDVSGQEAGYKIHIIYNVTATPSDKEYETAGEDISLTTFQWDLSTIPVELEGFRGAAHIIIKTNDLDPILLAEIEEILYGSGTASASLMPMDEMVSYINNWFRIKITDHGDGTWTASTSYDGYIFLLGGGLFRIDDANAIYIAEDTYLLSDSKTATDIAAISISDNGNGTWTAYTAYDDLIVVIGDTFEIRNANVTVLDEDSYTLSDTPE